MNYVIDNKDFFNDYNIFKNIVNDKEPFTYSHFTNLILSYKKEMGNIFDLYKYIGGNGGLSYLIIHYCNNEKDAFLLIDKIIKKVYNKYLVIPHEFIEVLCTLKEVTYFTLDFLKNISTYFNCSAEDVFNFLENNRMIKIERENDFSRKNSEEKYYIYDYIKVYLRDRYPSYNDDNLEEALLFTLDLDNYYTYGNSFSLKNFKESYESALMKKLGNEKIEDLLEIFNRKDFQSNNFLTLDLRLVLGHFKNYENKDKDSVEELLKSMGNKELKNVLGKYIPFLSQSKRDNKISNLGLKSIFIKNFNSYKSKFIVRINKLFYLNEMINKKAFLTEAMDFMKTYHKRNYNSLEYEFLFALILKNTGKYEGALKHLSKFKIMEPKGEGKISNFLRLYYLTMLEYFFSLKRFDDFSSMVGSLSHVELSHDLENYIINTIRYLKDHKIYNSKEFERFINRNFQLKVGEDGLRGTYKTPYGEIKEEVTINFLNGLHINGIEGNEVFSNRKKLRRLFECIVIHSFKNPISRERIKDIMWSKGDVCDRDSNLRVNMSMLSNVLKNIGLKDLIVSKSGFLTINDRYNLKCDLQEYLNNFLSGLSCYENKEEEGTLRYFNRLGPITMFFENTELFNYEKDIIKELENAYKIKCRIYMNIHKNLNNSVLSNYYEHYGSSYNIIKKKELSENVFIDEDDFKELLGNILF